MSGDHCPGVLRLHEAADGWLARVRLPGGRLRPQALDAIAEVSALGNGLVELTSRASVQIRGLTSGSAQDAARRLEAAGLMPSMAHERVRNILASPVAGRHPDSLASTDDVVAELDRGLCADSSLAELPGRFLFAVEDGSAALGPHRADVSLANSPPAGEVAFRLRLAGRATTLTATPGEAAGLALRGARAFLVLARADGADAWGVSALHDGPGRLARELGGALLPDPLAVDRDVAIGEPLEVGTLTQIDGRVTVTVLPALGRLDGPMLRGLAECSRRHRCEVRVSPRRTVSVIDLARAEAQPVTSELGSLGLVTSPASGWRGLSACAGKGACAKARVDVRRAAERRAAVRDAGAPAEHWSGCERRCGKPIGSPVTVTAADSGLIVEIAGETRTVETVAAALELLEESHPRSRASVPA
jgi:precorrin-3B synthase